MTDAERIAEAVAQAKEQIYPAEYLQTYLANMPELRVAVARHLLERDPQCVRVPMKGTVT